MKSLLDEAKKLEKKYEWLQAAEVYKKASKLATKNKDFWKIAGLDEKIGFCLYRAAFQSETREDFRVRINLTIEAYKKAINNFRKTKKEKKEVKIKHNTALIAYTKLWLNPDLSKRDILFNQYWTLEKEVLSMYEKAGDYLAVGKLCNSMIRGCHDQRLFYAKDVVAFEKISMECFSLGEKAIEVLSKIENNYQLTFAYSWSSWLLGFVVLVEGYQDMKKEYPQKSVEYSRKALILSEKIGDDYLTCWVNNSASLAALIYEGNPQSALKYNEKTRKHSPITRDKVLMGLGMGWASGIIGNFAYHEEDPEKYRETLKVGLKWSQESISYINIINLYAVGFSAYSSKAQHFITLSSLETNIEKRRTLLKEAIRACEEFFKFAHGNIELFDWYVQLTLAEALLLLSKTEKETSNKQNILEQVLENGKEISSKVQQKLPRFYLRRSRIQNLLTQVQFELIKSEINHDKKNRLIKESIFHIETCISFMEKDSKQHSPGWKTGYYGKYYYSFGDILNQYYLYTENKNFLRQAIDFSTRTIEIFSKSDFISQLAESYWQKAKLLDSLGEYLSSAKNYESAAKKYEEASEKIPQLNDFYRDYSLYMQAWSHIEQARNCHSVEIYEEARQHYEQAAELHELTSSWNYLTPNYVAWANMEEAEGLSRKENTQQAKQTFQKAFEYFCNAEEVFKQSLEKITSPAEKEMTQRLFEASDLRQQYCQARILMEDAKLLDREGNYRQSSRNYGVAAQTISQIVDKIDVEVERKELEYLVILCRAWEKMGMAGETTSSEAYIDAAILFEEAKNHCHTKKASLWALGNSNFCKGLAAGLRYRSSMDMKENVLAKRYIKDAASSYLDAGFKTASEYAKATQRLFDAYAYINQAENELDQEKRAKQYQMAENLLQIAAGIFVKAKQPEKTAQVQVILANVREEKALAISLSQVMQAPTIASSTLSFSAPTPTRETSVGLESFEHANVQANLVTPIKEVNVGESFCLSIEFVNAGREPALLMRVDDFIPSDFLVVKKPEIYRLEKNALNMKGKQLAPLKLVEVKFTLQPAKKGNYQLNPQVHYLDELGQNKSLQLKTVEIKVEEVIMEDRISTGTQELDSLLLGGIPKEYAVVLTGSPCDERELIVKNFLETGADEGVTFYVAAETAGLDGLFENPNFYLFLCNPKPKTNVPDRSNVYQLQSKADITNLGIALTKAYRNIDQSITNKRVCVEILSDVLVKHGTNTTREWVSSLITDLGAKGFTILAVMYPEMHHAEESKAILSLFDGEISILQSDDPLDCKKSILVKKLRNQDYIKNPICLR